MKFVSILITWLQCNPTTPPTLCPFFFTSHKSKQKLDRVARKRPPFLLVVFLMKVSIFTKYKMAREGLEPPNY